MHILSKSFRSALTVPEVRLACGSRDLSQTALPYETRTYFRDLNDKEII